ncbi:MAG: hypothetical protein AAF517_23715, partial [Planctomycetota bacterium]
MSRNVRKNGCVIPVVIEGIADFPVVAKAMLKLIAKPGGLIGRYIIPTTDHPVKGNGRNAITN